MDAIIIEENNNDHAAACIVDENKVELDNDVENDEEDTSVFDDDGIVKNEDGTVTVTLQYPVEVIFKNGEVERRETIKTLTFHRARGEDLIASGKFRNDTERGFVLMARMARVSDIIMRKMDGVDVDRCGRAIAPFFPKSRKTGKTSSR